MSSAPYSGKRTRRNVVAFLLGKIPTGLLTASVLGLSARCVTAAEFGSYVLAIALLELLLGLSTLGLDWVLLRYIPSYRVHGNRRGLLALILKIALVRLLVLALVAGVLVLYEAPLRRAGLALAPQLVWLFALLLMVEGGMRIFRDNALEALALQPQIQLCTLLKGCLLVAALSYLPGHRQVTAVTLLELELLAAFLSLLLAAGCVFYAVRQVAGSGEAGPTPSTWQMLHVALHNYASGVVEYLYSPSFLIVVLAKTQPGAAIAGLGFVLRLVDLIRNYLPGMLVFSVVRARMIGAYASDRNFGELRAWAQFVYKVSVLTLFPVIGVALVYGQQLLELASGGRYSGYSGLLTVLCSWLALRLHRLILGVVCNAVELPQVWSRSALTSLLALPLLYVVGYDRLGIWFIPLVLFSNEIAVNLLATRGMGRHGYRWQLPWGWLVKAVLAMLLASLAAWLLPAQGLLALGGGLCVLVVAYVGLLFLGRIFDQADRQLINRSVGRQVFA